MSDGSIGDGGVSTVAACWDILSTGLPAECAEIFAGVLGRGEKGAAQSLQAPFLLQLMIAVRFRSYQVCLWPMEACCEGRSCMITWSVPPTTWVYPPRSSTQLSHERRIVWPSRKNWRAEAKRSRTKYQTSLSWRRRLIVVAISRPGYCGTSRKRGGLCY